MENINEINKNDNIEFLNYIKKLDPNIWELQKSFNSKMNVSGKLFLSNNLLDKVDIQTINQISNVASLPGIVGSALAMPDVHVGYGFTIGGVAAFREENGVLVPGGVGFDINCGVRLIRTNLKWNDFIEKRSSILDRLFKLIPSGLGKSSEIHVSDRELNDAIVNGSRWSVENGFGIEEDILYCEENGIMNENDISLIGKKAYKRGKNQFGTIGSGNHFLEIQYVDKIYNQKVADVYGLFEGQICIMIHCGSRGFGHQICTDYIQKFNDCMYKYNIDIIDPELSCAPIDSYEAQEYFKAMSCAANYAWANRQIITHLVRTVFEEIYESDFESLGMNLVYDVSHNIVKKEKHKFENEDQILYVHRKGATRAFPSHHNDIPKKYFNVGQPVLIPGSMGTPSYVLNGSNKSMDLTFGSACHGSGRLLSRCEAKKIIDNSNVLNNLSNSNISIRSSNLLSISSEAPEAYKLSSDVVNVIDELNIANKVIRLKPLGVIKG